MDQRHVQSDMVCSASAEVKIEECIDLQCFRQLARVVGQFDYRVWLPERPCDNVVLQHLHISARAFVVALDKDASD